MLQILQCTVIRVNEQVKILITSQIIDISEVTFFNQVFIKVSDS